MKKLIAFIFVVSFNLLAIEPIQDIKQLDGLTKGELYNKSIEWIAKSFVSANDVIQVKDQENGKIIAKCISYDNFDFGIKRHFSYTLTIDLKDGKVRTLFENIKPENIGGVAGPGFGLKKQHDKVVAKIESTRSTLYSALESKENTDW
jgi:hypothetical protein